MFNSSKQPDTPYPADMPFSPTPHSVGQRAATVIARGVKVEGEFRSEGDVVIEGDVQGTISTGGVLTVGTDAHITADVSAEEANVSGSIEGNLTVKGQAMFHASAKINGDVSADRLTVEAGARLDGRIRVGGDSTATPPAKVESEPAAADRDSGESPKAQTLPDPAQDNVSAES